MTAVDEAPPRSSGPAPATATARTLPRRLVARWQRFPERRLVLAALGVWLSSRVAYAIAIWSGLFVDRPGPSAGRPGFFDAMYRWDSGWYLLIARHWYFWPGFERDRFGFGQGHVAFLPMPPLLIRAVELLTGSYALAGLLVSAVASAVAFVALSRLVRFELGDLAEEMRERGARIAPWLLAFSPYGVFLFLPYSEPVFLAFALPAWLAARQSRWRTSGLLLAGATATKINGLFLVAAVVLLYLLQRRRDGLPLLRPVALWLLVPFTTIGAYFSYLHSRTGDWDAWRHAQERSWKRTPKGLGESWSITWHAAFGRGRSDYLWARRSELLAAVLGVVLVVLLLWFRRWAESLYVALTWLALATNGIYLSFPRSTLLWFPGVVLLARAVAKRPPIAQAVLSVTAPLAFVLGAAWAASAWVN